MPRDFNSEQEIEVARDDARGVLHPIPAANVIDDLLRILIDGRALIADKANWWQGNDKDICWPHGEERSCAAMAIVRSDPSKALVHRAVLLLAEALPVPSTCNIDVYRFNDSHTHADVLALFDRAISARRAELEGVK